MAKIQNYFLYALVVLVLTQCAPYEPYSQAIVNGTPVAITQPGQETTPLEVYFNLPKSQPQLQPYQGSNAPSAPLDSYDTLVSPPVSQQVISPTAYTSPLSRSTIIHEVGPLESLWRIAKMYDVNQKNIMKANNLNSSELSIGQKLKIPGAAPMAPVIYLYPSNKWQYIVVHHTASDVGSARLVNQWHQSRGFQHGLGYHFLIDNGTSDKVDGQIETSPRWIRQQNGAHCKAADMNKKAIGISLVGNFSTSQPTPSQLESLAFLIRELMAYYNIPESRVIRHSDARGAVTECPGTHFPWNKLKNKI